jgi:hypothetical protein
MTVPATLPAVTAPRMTASIGVVAFVLIGAHPLFAWQDRPDSLPPASQHGTVSQTVNHTIVTVGYDRPVARGRELFGGILEWDVTWTPGANRATWIDVSTPFTFEGHELEAGRYGLWMVTHETEPWEVILVGQWDTHHSYFSFETEKLRIRVSPEPGAHMEALAFYFPVVGPYETTLRMHWGETILPLRIGVPRQ